jgi:hypothetical protein
MYVDGVSRATTTDSTNYSTTSGTWFIASNDFQAPANVLTGYISNLRVVKGTAVYTSTFTPSTTPLTAIANTSLLTCQSNRLIDNSTNNFTITKAGDTSISPATPFTTNSSYSTYGSTYFDGTGDTLTISSLTPGLSFGTGEFTIEMWVYKTSAENDGLLDARSGATATPWFLGIDASNFPYLYDGTSYASSVAVTLNSWSHVAAVRTSGVLKMFVNGVQGYSASYSVNLDRTAGLVIGDTVHAIAPLLGYISDLRIVKGTAVYTSAFTPPTSPLTAVANTQLLTLQYNGGATNQAIIDNSNFNNIITRFGNTSQGSFSPYSVTGWSNYFDGTGDYLSVPTTSTQNQWWTTDFTIDAWVYPTNLSTWLTNTNPCLIGNMAAGSSTNYWSFGPNTNGTVRFKYFNGGSVTVDSTETISLNQWSHIAFVKDSNGIRIYVNGVGTTSTAVSGTPSSDSGLIIGQHFNSSILGYVSNLRIVKGTALYTSTFTPSTTPLTAIANTSLLTCQSNRLIDNSINNFTLTRNGDVSVQAYSPFGSIPEAVPISYSNYFDTSSYLTITSSSLAFGTGDFTVEFWSYLIGTTLSTTVPGNIFRSNSNGEFSIYFVSNGVQIARYNVGSDLTSSSVLPVAGVWEHWAFTRSSGTGYIFKNGALAASGAIATNYASSGTIILNPNSQYISNLRVVKGTALYTSAFTPSTTPLTTTSQGATASQVSLLTCQSTTMIDNSTNRFTLTANGNVVPRIFNPFGYTAQSTTSYTSNLQGGSAYFDGTGDYLTVSGSTVGFGTNAYTIEFWIYRTAAPGMTRLFVRGTDSTDFSMDLSAVGVLTINNNTTIAGSTCSTSIPLNSWTNITLVRTSTSASGTAWYINGVASGTFTHSTNIASGGTLIISTADNILTGYLSDLRITKGFALYTSNFIPPTTSVTAIPNTTLLLNFNNGGIIDLHGSNVLETVGNTQLSTSVKKYNNSSIYFDGTGDYLKVPSSVAFAFGTGDFTWEAWVYFNSTGGRIIDFNTGILWLTSGTLQYYSGSGRITSNALTLGQWYHVALVRGSGVTKMYINGTQNGVNFTDSINYPTNALIIGSDSGSLTQFMSGYIDDLRITKGYARYTSNFTAPTSAFIGK